MAIPMLLIIAFPFFFLEALPDDPKKKFHNHLFLFYVLLLVWYGDIDALSRIRTDFWVNFL